MSDTTNIASAVIESDDDILDSAADTDVNNGEPDSSVLIDISWDKSAVIRRATKEYIDSISVPITLTDVEMRDGLVNYINQAIAERNIVQGGSKVTSIQSLPNPCVADLILAKYHVRCISWSGSRDDGNMVAIYQEDGVDKGVYIGTKAYFNNLVRGFEYTAKKSDVEEIMEILEADAEFVKPSMDKDLLAFNNGIFNYKTKQLLPFSPDICFTAKSRVNYPQGPLKNPTITMPDGVVWDFDSWLNSLSDNPEIIELILKVLGAILRPNVRWDKIVCFYSQVGMNGKGTLCELMKQLCGEKTYASIPFIGFEKDSLLAQLITATAVITDENGTNDYAKNVANLKALATGDSISIDRKFKTAITLKFSGLIVQCVNSLPRVADQTDSFYRRCLMVPFEKTFKDVERKYIKNDYLHRPEVLEYVLWKVMNMPDYYELPEPDECKALLDDYKAYNDPILEFITDVFSRFVWEKIPQDFVYDLYLKWCIKNNPSGKIAGRRSVMDKIKTYIATKFNDEWLFDPRKVRIGKNDNLDPELMIVDYGLENWRSKTYKGTDPAKISMPSFNQAYTGMFIKIGGQPVNDSDAEVEG